QPAQEFVSEQPVIAAPFGREVRFIVLIDERAEVEEVVASAASVIEPEFGARFVAPDSRADFPGPVEAQGPHRSRIEFEAFELASCGGGDLEAVAESRALLESADHSVEVVNDFDGRDAVIPRREA